MDAYSTNKTKSETQLEVLNTITNLFDFSDILVYDFKVEKLNIRGKEDLYAIHTVSMDMKKYIMHVKRIMSILDKICTYKDVSVSDLGLNKEIMDTLNQDIIIKSAYFNFYIPFDRHGYSAQSINGLQIAYSTSKMRNYFFDIDSDQQKEFFDKIYYIFNKKIVFTVESDEEFDSTLAEDKIRFENCYENRMIIPIFRIDTGGGSRTKNVVKFKYVQKLSLSRDKLLNLKQIHGGFRFESLKR